MNHPYATAPLATADSTENIASRTLNHLLLKLPRQLWVESQDAKLAIDSSQSRRWTQPSTIRMPEH